MASSADRPANSIRALAAVRDGGVVFAQAGALPPAALEQVISAVRGLDMADVRAKLAAEHAPAR
jgi:thioredoxin